MPMDENVDYFLNEKMHSFLFFNDSKYLNSEAILPIVAFYSSGQKNISFLGIETITANCNNNGEKCFRAVNERKAL